MLKNFNEYIDNNILLITELNNLEMKYPNLSELFIIHNDPQYGEKILPQI